MIIHDVAGAIDNRFAVFVFDLLAGVSEVEIELAVRTEDEGMNSVVVLRALDACEQDFLAVGVQVSVVVDQEEDTVAD